MKAPPPPDEETRLQALRRYAILDTEPEQSFDDLTLLASQVCGTPVAVISLLDETRQWFKAKVGTTEDGTPRDIAFCAHGIAQGGVFVVNDARTDQRFADNPLVTGHPRIRFYAGAPLLTPDGQALGMLCVTDQVPRELSAAQKTALQALSRQVVAQLELRRSQTELQVVAQLKRAQEELAWKRAFLEAQVNSSLDGVLVVDAHGKKLLQNQRMTDLWQMPREIAEEITDENWLRWVADMVKDPGPFLKKVAHLYAHPDEISQDEIELKDGTMLDRYSAPVRGKDGKYYGRIWTFRDITGRKQAEAALRESEARFAGAFEHAPIGVALVSPDGRWLKVNRALCDLVGYSEAGLLARTFQDITHPDDLETDLENVRRMIAGEIHSYQMEKRYVHARGHLVTVLLDVTLVRDGQGRPLYFISQIQDITQRRRAEHELARVHAQLLAASRQAGMAEFATGILHNVGNVLNSVNVASTAMAESLAKSKSANLSKVVELLREHEKDLGDFLTNDPRGRQVPVYLAHLAGQLAGEQAGALKELAQLQKNIEHIRDMVGRQQDSAKRSAGTETVNLTELVDHALGMVFGGPVRPGVEIVRRDQAAPPVRVEKTKVLQILVNLVSNARQACEASVRPRRKLTVRTAVGRGHIRIAVRDDGIGIPSENLGRIFTHGFTTKKDGHGFGLHSAAQAAGEMGGSLTVRSAGSGRGATFTLELPRNPNPPAP